MKSSKQKASPYQDSKMTIMPDRTMSHSGWTGDSYIAIDEQGNGAYMLSSGEAGGRIALSMASAFPPVEKPDLKGLQVSFKSWLSKKGISYSKLINACPFGICGDGDTACNTPINTKQQQFQISSFINLLLDFIVPDAEAVLPCVVVGGVIVITIADMMFLSIIVLMLAKMGENIYKDSKSRSDDYPNDDYCTEIWVSDTAWCDNNFTGRANDACHRWAQAELYKCLAGEPRAPFRL